MQLSWQKVTLPLKETFSISYGNYSFREALIVSLSHEGCIGYGECTIIDYYGINSLDLTAQLTSSKTLIESVKIATPQVFYQFISSLNLSSFVTSALDCAYWDLFGKLENKNFFQINAIEFKKTPKSSITISIDNFENQIDKINKSTWEKFKIKCKGLDKNNFLKLVHLDKDIALDSNASFSEKDCNWIQNQVDTSKFSYIEQPMLINSYEILSRHKFANWMADEDFQNINHLISLQPHYSSVNIKLVKCGGLTPALDIIKEAKKLDYKIMIGCMTESSIGISAGAVLAPLVDYCDLDGANLIAKDIAKGTQIVNGIIEFTEKPGLGIELIK